MDVSSLRDDPIDWGAYAIPEEIRELHATARAHFATLTSSDDLRAIHGGAPAPELWETLVEHGYTLVGCPEQFDGLGTLTDLIGLLEEAGRALLPAPLTSHAAATQTLIAVDRADESITTEQHALAEQSHDHLYVFDGSRAKHAVSLAATPDLRGTVVRKYRLSNVEPQRLNDVDPTRPTVRFDLSALELTAEVTVDAAPDYVRSVARTCLAADLIGTAERALQGGIEHAKAREQFGRAIGSFQGIKHQLADAHLLIERARSLTIGAAVANAHDTGSTRSAQLSMLAKASAADAAARATALHVQLLGAMGLTFEADSPLEVRRARHTIPVLDTPCELYAASAALTLAEGSNA